jgi:hypothetical protein
MPFLGLKMTPRPCFEAMSAATCTSRHILLIDRFILLIVVMFLLHCCFLFDCSCWVNLRVLVNNLSDILCKNFTWHLRHAHHTSFEHAIVITRVRYGRWPKLGGVARVRSQLLRGGPTAPPREVSPRALTCRGRDRPHPDLPPLIYSLGIGVKTCLFIQKATTLIL